MYTGKHRCLLSLVYISKNLGNKPSCLPWGKRGKTYVTVTGRSSFTHVVVTMNYPELYEWLENILEGEDRI